MSSGRNTGTVPKTKHNSRTRRENPVNHIPNNLEWHHPDYVPRRVRKESNNYASHLSDAGEDFGFEAWTGMGSSNRTDDDELRWSNVKSNNITPERGGIDNHHPTSRVVMQRQENHGPEERHVPESIKMVDMARGRLKIKMEQSEKKIEELQQQQAALMTLRNKAIQQVKPVQIEEIQQQHTPMMLRNKAIQQVKPVQMEMDKIGNLNEQIHETGMMQLLKALENGNETPVDQQLRSKINELIAKKAQCDKILCCIDSDNVQEGAGSVSSDDGDTGHSDRFNEGASNLGAEGGEPEEHNQNVESGVPWDGVVSRREAAKQDNREFDNMAAIAAFIENKEMKLEEVKSKFEQLQTLMTKMERLRDIKLHQRRMNADSQTENIPPNQHQHHQHHPEPTPPVQPQFKNCAQNGPMEKVRVKKMGLDQGVRQVKSYPPSTQSSDAPTAYQNLFEMGGESWANSSWNGPAPNSVECSSDEGEVEYDESPVKLCSTSLCSPSNCAKVRRNIPPNIPNGHPVSNKPPLVNENHQNRRHVSNSESSRVRQRSVQADENLTTPNNSTLALQITQLQMQMEQMQLMYQSMMEKQFSNFPNPPQQWMPSPQTMGFMHYLGGTNGPQWHQHQILVNSLNQCCQLIWHQQRELAALRQALAMLQDESIVYKCGGYGNNLNFESGLLWAQTSPQTLNNQVPPGNRANNYWDNFRSYSRQNLLSGRNKSNEGSIADSTVGTTAAPSAPPPPPPPPTTQTDNLRASRKDNSTTTNAAEGSFVPSQTRHVSNSFNNNGGRSRRRYNAGTVHKTDPTVFSLEQSIYSELETVLAETERNPQVLIQLLTQLKTLRSHRNHFDDGHTAFEGDCDLIDQTLLPNFSTGSQYGLMQQQTQTMEDSHPNQQDDFLSKVLADVSRMIERKEYDICTPEFLQLVVGTVTERVSPQLTTKLEASLLKFQGVSLEQVGHVLLCDIASIVWSHASNEAKQQTLHMPVVNGPVSTSEQEPEEEGAVGGVPLPTQTQSQHHQNTQQNIETELAEADQTQHNSSENNELFWGLDEIGPPTVEMDNQELPPREENVEHPFQENWMPSPSQGL